ncbi:UDP-glucose 4-epimerase [Zopfochytrium polystomum]|nr:UDP-glucose 4-epimerase [Zopfochytrium polystomum]
MSRGGGLTQLTEAPLVACPAPCVLVTGGAGFLGSHTVLELLQAGREVVVVDSLRSSSKDSLLQAQILSGRKIKAFHQIDLLDADAVRAVLLLHPGVFAVLHFAGLKSVSESWVDPLSYYHTNYSTTMNLFRELLGANNSHREDIIFIFSSSACVYGDPIDAKRGAVDETHPRFPKSPYGRTKVVVEDLVQDICSAHASIAQGRPVLKAALLRYFNPVGAHPSGALGECPLGRPTNLLPLVVQAALRAHTDPTLAAPPILEVFGADWDTADGTAVRDYLHVVDVAHAHVKVLQHLEQLRPPPSIQERGWNCLVYNVGSGRGYSVLDVIHTMEEMSGVKIPFRWGNRRKGDTGKIVANASKAWDDLRWKATKNLQEICRDAWNFQLRHLDQLAKVASVSSHSVLQHSTMERA